MNLFDFWAPPRDSAARTKSDYWVEKRLAVVTTGRHICFGKGGGGSAPSPDPQIGQAAIMNAKIGEDWLAFAKDQFKVGNSRQVELDALNKSVVESQLETQANQSKWALEDRARYKEQIEPLQDQYIAEAKNYDSPEKLAQVASAAKADIESESAARRQINQREMAAMGVNPNSVRFQSLERGDAIMTAASSVNAQNVAKQAIKDRGMAYRADAINMGSGLPSQAMSAASLGLNAGNSAIGNSSSTNANWRANVGIVSSGYGGAMQGYANQGNILNNLYSSQLQAWNAQQNANATSAAGFGSAVGTIAGAGISVF